jgi:multidrug efflux pump subunit AcrA (membrane-fusion protein)
MNRPVLLLSLLALSASCTPKETPAAASEGAAPVVTERWVRAEGASSSPLLAFAGTWIHDANAHAELGVPARATVVRVNVAPGERVLAGAALVTLSLPDAVEARGSVAAAELRAGAYRERLSRLEELRAEGLARGADVADMTLRLAEARASKEEASARLRALESSGLFLRGGTAELRAPFDGIVTDVDAPVGSVVDGSSGALVTLVAPHGRRIEARVPFAVRDDATFSLLADGGATVPLTLISQAPEVQSGDGMRRLWLEAPEGTVGVGGAAVRLRADFADGWIVPADALARNASVVRVRDRGDVPAERLFALGGSVLVKGALREGDFVALEGAAR